MSQYKDKPSSLFTKRSPKKYLTYWLWSIIIFIVLIFILILVGQPYKNTWYSILLLILILIDVFLGIVFFIAAFISFFIDLISNRRHFKEIHIDKWYLLAILAIIVFAYLFYFKITNDNKIKQNLETPTYMDCLKLGSDNARIACIKYYQLKQ